MNCSSEYIVVCPGVNIKKNIRNCRYIELEHINDIENTNVFIDSSSLITRVFSDDRLIDLLDIAGYISAAEVRSLQAGDNDAESCSLHRSFHFHIKVRDYKFWCQSDVQDLLAQVLCFISAGDSYKFIFCKADPCLTTGILDNTGFWNSVTQNLKITLFSGGLDSLAGTIDLLETTNDNIILISHQPVQPGISRSQNKPYSGLEKVYPGRCTHFKFHCGLTYGHPADSTHRTASFLHNAAAFAIAETFKQDNFYVYANGIDSMNFGISQDLLNADASGTADSKTLGLFEKLFTRIYHSIIRY